MSGALTPADHAFVSALTALSLVVVANAADEALYLQVAASTRDKICRDSAIMQRLFLAYVGIIAAKNRPRELASARFGLTSALEEFHRWRMGRAVGAMPPDGTR